MSGNKSLGDFGERLAVAFLEQKGYRIRGRQVRTRYGEIDIVAENAVAIIFVEVKTRRTTRFGLPEESITMSKRQHLAHAVDAYRVQEGIVEKNFRVDAITILLDEQTHKATVRHIPDILMD